MRSPLPPVSRHSSGAVLPQVLTLLCGLAMLAALAAGTGLFSAHAALWPFSSGSEHKIRQDRTSTLDGAGLARLALDDVNGNIAIRGGSGSQITIRAIKELRYKSKMSDADASRTLESVKVEITPQGDKLQVHTVFPKLPDGMNASVNYEVQLPEAMHVEARTANGNIAIRDVTGAVLAETNNGNEDFLKLGGTLKGHTHNGNINVREVTGTAEVDSSNGNVSCRQIGAALSAKSANGNIDVRTVQGSVKASTGNGNLHCRDVDGDVELAGNNGGAEIVQSRRFEKTSRITVEKHIGNVNLTLAETQPFQLEAQCNTGSIQCAFPVKVEGKGMAKRASGQVGEGGPAIKLTTGIGRIAIRKK